MSLVCSDQIVKLCALDDVTGVTKPSGAQAIPATGPAHGGRPEEGLAVDLPKFMNVLKLVNLLDADGEPTETLKQYQAE